MNFASIEFAIFLPIVFLLYWFVFNKSLKIQNFFILVCSYFFYGWWDWRFLILIFISTLTDYLVGFALASSKDNRNRKLLLLASILVNLSMLGFFKYFNFFIDSFITAFSFFGFSLTPLHLSLILPVGISFYTLQSLSYTIDVYDKKITPTSDFISFFAYVSFFPQLVAGPIEKATTLLPQFHKKRVFNGAAASDGLRQILWGLFKKVVIADNCEPYFSEMIANFNLNSGSTNLLLTFIGSIKIYCDFSGYSDMAIGMARLFGFNLMRNFNFPFFARNLQEFWQKWHISLISWIREYIFERLKGIRKWRVFRNIFIVFIAVGIWHGASWTFVTWGILHALFFMFTVISKKQRKFFKPVAYGRLIPSFKELYQMFETFSLFSIIGVFFILGSVKESLEYLSSMFNMSMFTMPSLPSKTVLAGIIIMFIVEWVQRNKEHGLDFSGDKIPTVLRWLIYYVIVGFIIRLGGQQQDFVYFQF